MKRRAACLLVVARFFGTPAVPADSPATSATPIAPTYEQHIRPILKAHCFHCHGEDGHREGSLDLRLRRLILEGGDSGPALVPGQPDESMIVERLRAGEMPPTDKKLPPEDIATIIRWIATGASTARPEPEQVGDGPLFTDEERGYWAFQPIRRPAVPSVERADQVRTPIDAFLLARLEREGLSFSPEADSRMLVRRAFFDLVGLPPSPDEINAILADDPPHALAFVVDRLLSSPHCGERWGRHWLDVAGYADSEGYTEADTIREWAFGYRDYVVRAFNADKPFDRFIQEQLAGDELLAPPYSNLSPEAAEMLRATGLLRMAPDGTGSGGVDQNVARNQVIADTLQIVATSLLGMTVHCAQCHDHRYDPIPQADYYRLRAVFEPALDWKNWKPPSSRQVSLYTDADRELAGQIEAEAAAVDEERQRKAQEFIDRTLEVELQQVIVEQRDTLRTAYKTPARERTPEQQALLKQHPTVGNLSAGSLYLYEFARTEKFVEQLKEFSDRAVQIRARKPAEAFIRALTETPGQVPTTFVFHRGDFDQPKEEVTPGDLSILSGTVSTDLPADDPALPTTGRRLALARHLTSGQHPLVARVIANRIWLHHFGRGLVNTPGDIGVLGERPTHPELLDWLAAEFMDSGWSVKHLHRLIMNSTAYRQSSRRRPELDEIDPDNKLYARMALRRLEAEVVRDAMLAATGRLNSKMFGPPVPVMEDDVGQIVIGRENLDGERKPTEAVSLGGEEHRRSLYIQVRRSRPLAVLDTFDAPLMSPHCDNRSYSTSTSQSLFFMNSALVVDYAGEFARRLTADDHGDLGETNDARNGHDMAATVTRAWTIAFGREPAADELRDATNFLEHQRHSLRSRTPDLAPAALEQQALTSFCQALFSANGFLYVD